MQIVAPTYQLCDLEQYLYHLKFSVPQFLHLSCGKSSCACLTGYHETYMSYYWSSTQNSGRCVERLVKMNYYVCRKAILGVKNGSQVTQWQPDNQQSREKEVSALNVSE